jgi:DNA polymerase-3 subunit beta
MKFNVQHTLLMGGLKLPCSLALSKPVLPILSHVLLSADSAIGTLIIAGTDLEICAVRMIEAEVSESGSIALPAKLLYDFVSQVNDNLSIEMDKKTMSVTLIGETTHAKATIKGLNAQEFPPIPGFNPMGIEFPTPTLIRLSRLTTFSASSETARGSLTGVHIYTHPETKRLCAIATDGFRFSLFEADVDFSMTPVTIPARTMIKFAELTGTIHLEYDRSAVTLSSGDTVIKSQVLDGPYPTIFESFLQEKCTTESLISPTSLLKACSLANLFATENNLLILDFTESGINVTSQGEQTGDSTLLVACKLSGKPMKIAANGKYIKEILEVLSNADTVTIAMTTATKPIIFSSESIPGFRHVIMPMSVV